MKRMIASAFWAVALCFTTSCKPVWQPDPGNAAYERGQEAHNRGDVAQAILEWRLATRHKNSQAQFKLGEAHYLGEGVDQSYEEAALLFRLAAEQGNTNAEYALGISYSEGRGVPLDYAESLRWFRLAAEQGHTRAQRNVGYAYELGLGVTTNKVESAKWYRLAAEQADPFAQFALGSMYAKGEGVPRNDLLAYKWWNLAAAYGYGHPANITTLEGRMTPDQIAEAQKLSAEWKPLSER